MNLPLATVLFTPSWHAELADQYLVMSRGEIVQQGRGENMEAEGVRGLVTI